MPLRVPRTRSAAFPMTGIEGLPGGTTVGVDEGVAVAVAVGVGELVGVRVAVAVGV